MRNITTTKISLIIIFLFSVLLISCKNKKECDLYDLVQRYYSGEDISIIDSVINYSISSFSTLQNGIVCGGSQLKVLEKNHLETLWFFFNEKDYTQDMLVFYIHLFRVKKTKKITETLYIIKDYKRIPAFSEFEMNYENVSYGEPIINRRHVRNSNENGFFVEEKFLDTFITYNVDEKIYGIYAYEGKYPPYNKKVKPKYLVYVENNKLVVEEPKDDKYFIYRIPEL